MPSDNFYGEDPEQDYGNDMPAVLIDFNDWGNLHMKDPATLTELGFSVWEKTEERTHWLFPKEWYGIIPDGHPITYITGEQATFKRGETDYDYRFGCLAFGFIQQTGN